MSTFSDRLIALLASRYVDGDDENNLILDSLLGAIAAAGDQLDVIAFGTDDVPAGKALNDPSVAPTWALAHAGQYTGGIMPGRLAGESMDAYLTRARSALVYPAGIKRGTEEAVRRALEPLLTGTKAVFISVSPGDPYTLVVRTITSETPDPAAVALALAGSYVSGGQRGAIRAELGLTYQVSDFVTFAEGTRAMNAVANGVTALNVTRGDVT